MADPAPKGTTPTSVYRYYDEAKMLIYVGITSRRALRNQQHNSDKEWWQWVATQEVDHFDTREAAHSREVALIQQYRPPFNKHHNPDATAMRQAYIGLRASGLYGGQADESQNIRSMRVVVSSISPDYGRAELRTLPEHAGVARRLVHVDGRLVHTDRGKSFGKVTAIHASGPCARLMVEMRRNWSFTAGDVLLRPIQKKGGRVEFEIKKIVARDATNSTDARNSEACA